MTRTLTVLFGFGVEAEKDVFLVHGSAVTCEGTIRERFRISRSHQLEVKVEFSTEGDGEKQYATSSLPNIFAETENFTKEVIVTAREVAEDPRAREDYKRGRDMSAKRRVSAEYVTFCVNCIRQNCILRN